MRRRPFVSPRLVRSVAFGAFVALVAVAAPACKRGAPTGADAAAESGSASGLIDGSATRGDAAPASKAAGAGGPASADPPFAATTPSVPPPGDMICFAAGTGGKATPARPPPPAPARGGHAAPSPHTSHALKIDHPVAFTILHQSPCFAGSCTAAPATCTASRRGYNITLNARMPSPDTRPVKPCTTDCTAIVAKCQSDPLPAGTYTVELGGRKHYVIIPSTSAPACAN